MCGGLVVVGGESRVWLRVVGLELEEFGMD